MKLFGSLSSILHPPSPVFKDPRVFQIVFQGALIATGLVFRAFFISPTQIALTFLAGCLTQWVFLRALGLKDVGYKSALITCNGLVLFLRAESWWIHPLAAFLAMASKFVIRFRGKHIYNPSNFGAIVTLLLFPGTWLAPGQWGNHFLMAAWCVALGSIVIFRAGRNDISWTFLMFYLGALALRVLTHGQSWWVWIYEVNGALLIFTFFMISDPMTIPDRRPTRVLFAALVAGVAYLLQYEFYQFNAALWNKDGMQLTPMSQGILFHPNGLLFALFLCAPLAPLMDRIWRGKKYDWKAPAAA